jgi:hypothetical protein
MGFQMLIDKFELTHSEIASIAGKSRSYITNSLSILKIDEFLHACLIWEELTVSHVRLINMAPDNIAKYRLADIVMDWKLTVKELEAIITSLREDRKFLNWTREIRIENIKIPATAFEPNSTAYEGNVTIDTRMVLWVGLESLMKAKRSGQEKVEVEVIYMSDWLKPSEAWTRSPTVPETPSNLPPSQFAQVLADLIENTEEMFERYPVHGLKSDED